MNVQERVQVLDRLTDRIRRIDLAKRVITICEELGAPARRTLSDCRLYLQAAERRSARYSEALYDHLDDDRADPNREDWKDRLSYSDDDSYEHLLTEVEKQALDPSYATSAILKSFE